jgi:hypothetical protein
LQFDLTEVEGGRGGKEVEGGLKQISISQSSSPVP